MKKLIFSKFLIDSFQFFLMISITATLIVWIIQAVNYLDFVTEDGHNFKVYILYAILNFPKIFSRLLPFIFFISLFYTLIKFKVEQFACFFNIFGTSEANIYQKKRFYLYKLLQYHIKPMSLDIEFFIDWFNFLYVNGKK